jgi:hypothetical protein
MLAGVNRQFAEQARDLCRSATLQHIIKRLEPFACFGGVEFRRVLRSDVSHGKGSFQLVESVGSQAIGL